MAFQLRSSPRQFFENGAGDPFLVYYIYGDFPELPTMPGEKYNSAGVPKGLTLQLYNRRQHADVLNSFLVGHFGSFLEQKPDINKPVRKARQCIVLQGVPTETSNLDYLRDCIGVLTYLLDYGGVAILDPQMLTWWQPAAWREQISAAGSINPLSHITLIGSPEEANSSLTWFHSRGMRKFGRPDLSLHNVAATMHSTIIDVLQQLATLQIFGGVISEQQEVEIEGLPNILHCCCRGDDSDPIFNNRHISLE